MKDVIISVKGLLGANDEGEDIELVTGGKYSYSGEEANFEYMESELTGMEGTKTSFSVTPDAVTITRNGTVNMQMLFEEGRKNYFIYDTPYGSMKMGLDTQSVFSRLGENGGHLEVKYVIDLENSTALRTAFNIDIREQNNSLPV